MLPQVQARLIVEVLAETWLHWRIDGLLIRSLCGFFYVDVQPRGDWYLTKSGKLQ